MKKSLLMAVAIAFGFNSNAQNLPLFEDFNNGLPAGWTLNAAGIGSYGRIQNGNCVTNTGVIAGPSIGSNGNNKTGFTTAALQYADANSIVVVRFEGYAYQGNQLRCEDQLFASTPCTAVGRIYITDAATGDTLGSSDEMPLNLTTGINTLVAQVNGTVPPLTEFIVFLDISNVSCNVNGALRFVLDNVLITVSGGGPLPVYFKSIKANRISAQQVSVKWITATEQNNRGFYVQRNTGGTWEEIAFIASRAMNGNSNTDLGYSYDDINNHKGISQYRIVQVDLGGKQKMSEVVMVKGAQTGKILVFPNPSYNGNATVLFEDQNSARDISVIDLAGRVVKQWTNVNSNNLKIVNLKPGFYSIRIFNRSTGKQAVEKIVVYK